MNLCQKTLRRRSSSAAIALYTAAFVMTACGDGPSRPTEEVDDPAAEGSKKSGGKSTKSASEVSEDSDIAKADDLGDGLSEDELEEEELPHVPVYDPDYPGLDEALVPDLSVPGCTDGYDEESRHLALTLDAEVYGVRIHASEGQLFANDRGCTHEGKALSVEEIERIAVSGTSGNDVVILDLSKGSFGTELYLHEGAFYFDLGSGEDHFLLRGDAEANEVYAGSADSRTPIALSSTARINAWVKSAEKLTYSLGPGDDTFLPIDRLNVGLYDVDSGGTLRISDLEMPVFGYGGDGNDSLRGGLLADTLVGGPGDDILSGAEGSDFFDEGALASGSDIINGGPGLDTVSYRFRVEDVRIELCTAETDNGCLGEACDCSATSGELDEGDVIVNFEIVRAGNGDDTLIGTDGDDFLYGEAGDDHIEGLAGSDVLQGGLGSDELFGGENADICDADENDEALSCEI